MAMRVLVVASTATNYCNLDKTGYIHHYDEKPSNFGSVEELESWARSIPSDIDEFHEACGRGCYESWGRPNPATNTNKTYLGHIIESDHLSVLGHGHVTFYVSGVSRALLLELERHQQRYSINFSVLSQRYVDHSEAEFVLPPIVQPGSWMHADMQAHHENCLTLYAAVAEELQAKGFSRKEARGAARAVLPENTETRFFVTGSIRAWRNIIEQRLSDAADAEIREFARLVLIELSKVAPNSMQDLIEKHLKEEGE